MNTNLSSRAVLVNLHISAWSARTFDRKGTRTVETAHDISDAGRFNKVLIDPTCMRNINQSGALLRDKLHESSLPWGDNGYRLLPSELFFEFQSSMNYLIQQRDAFVSEFITDYPQLIRNAQRRLGPLFSASDYPSPSVMAVKFGVSLSYFPIADTQDFRTTLTDDQQATLLKGEIANALLLRQTEATDVLLERLRCVVTTLVFRLDPPEGQNVMITTALVERTLSLTDMAGAMNLMDDPRITRIVSLLRAQYDRIHDLRGSQHSKDEVLRTCKYIMSIMDWTGI